jgi:hypothetical protein
MDFYRCYALDYPGARRKFIAATTEQGGRLTTFTHPDARGPRDERLCIDVAQFGEAAAPRQFVMISGTHGNEAFAGSAVQIAWLNSGEAKLLPRDVGMLMIHGLNPFGFAHWTRTTENNVDLNRNFVDHSAPYPENPYYGELHPHLCPPDWSREALAAADRAIVAFGERHGADVLYNTVMSGQHTHTSGLIYGGTRREWSNLMLEEIVTAHLGQAEKIGLIDWHTGIGQYKDTFFLSFNEDDLLQRASSWWGADKIVGQRPHGLARPNYNGLVFTAIQRFLRGRPMCGAVVEFGTRGIAMRHALRLDLWLRSQTDRSSEKYALLHAEMRDAFCPVNMDWREATIDLGLKVTRHGLDGLIAW